MQPHMRTVTILSIFIMIAASIAAAVGIFSNAGPGPYTYTSIRGQEVLIYGRGIYQHMSAEVAVQGIAQDYVTLLLGVPLLAVGLFRIWRGSLAGQIFLAGVLGYFLVTYLFYLIMGMYNVLFLVYAALLGTSFFAFLLTITGLDLPKLAGAYTDSIPVRFAGGFLVVNGITIALLWLSVVVPPLLEGIYPPAVEHYTTLIVQGMDLGLLLPLSIVSGVLLWQRRPVGLLVGPVYLVFLSLLMTALVAKIVGIGLVGGNIIPVVFIIPTTAVVTIMCATLMLRGVKSSAVPS